MAVAEHLVSLYVATCGQSGPGLGCDEKEIILLAYVILEAATGQIIGTKQILVRPDGGLIKDRCNSTSSDISVTTTTTTKIATSTPPPLPPPSLSAHITTIATTPSISTTSDASVNGNQNIVNGGFNIVNIINNNNNNSNSNSNSNINSSSSILQTTINDNITNNGTIVKLDNVTPTLTASTPIVGSSNINNNNNNILISNNNITNEVSPNGDHNELPPIALAMTVGKPLQEAIAEFDEYLLDLALRDTEFKIITDGQLPLRQCLHREACVKEFDLPSYYNNFSDLRKEYNNFKNGDMSRALVAVRDIPKMLQMPTTLMPQSIDAIIKDLNITSTSDNEFYMRECRDMVNVIQHLLKLGHKFTANETVNMILEPGICSIDDEIDGNCIVRARGLPWQSSDQDIAKFFRGLNVAKGGVALCLSPLGRRNGEALIRFISQEHRDMALKRHKHHIGNRYIEVYRATGEDFLSVAGGASNEALAFLSKGAQVIIRMRGLPYDCTAKQVLDFFNAGENPCQILDGTEGVLFVKKPDGRATGDAFVLFANDTDAPKALAKHRESIGQRYIELFRSTTAEVQQVLNRSLDPKTYEPNNQPPLIAQLPPMQLSLLPQHLITSGTTKNCIRLRGLPYEAMVEHILHFLDDFAKHIIYQGVHMVINAQGHPSGEAFIQMDSEDSARLCAQRKHHQFMVFGKKYRYIEVFQCSGDDMNNVLNGGIQSPGVSHAHSHTHLSSTKQQPAALLSPGSSIIANPFAALAAFVPTASLLASPPPPPSPHHYPTQPTHSSGQHHHHHHHHHNATAAYYTPSLVYWPYPSPPVSPNSTYLNRTTHQSPAQLTGTHHPHPMYALDYIAAIPAPTNFNSQQRSALAISPVNGGNVMMTPHKPPPPPPPPAAAVIPLMRPKHFTPTSPTYQKLNVASTTTINNNNNNNNDNNYNNNNNNNNDNNSNNNNIRSHQMLAIVTKDNATPAVLNVCLASNNKMLFTPTTTTKATTVPITIDKHHLHNDHIHHSTEADMGNAVKQQQQQQHCSSSPTSNAKDIAVVTTTPRVELFIS